MQSLSTRLLARLVILAFAVLLCSGAQAQQKKGTIPANSDTGPQFNGDDPMPQPRTTASAKSDNDPAETFKVNVNLVNVLFNVRDKHGALVPNLPKDDFDLVEDGKPQTIKYFKSESNLPLTLGILVDTSLSQERVLNYEKEAGAEFLKDVLTDKDLAFLVNFDVNVELAQDFTNSQRQLRDALNQTKINAGTAGGGAPGIGQGPFPTSNPKGTLLYDAVVLAAQEKLAHEAGRKAMILLTDGGDQGSYYKLEDALRSAQKSDSIVYVIFISDTAYINGYSEMKKLCEQTGGRVIDAGNKLDKLRNAFAQIAQELRSQYSLAYTPTNNKRDGSYRKLELRTKDGYKVQARKGYYAPQG